jgi:hypothetical protein
MRIFPQGSSVFASGCLAGRKVGVAGSRSDLSEELALGVEPPRWIAEPPPVVLSRCAVSFVADHEPPKCGRLGGVSGSAWPPSRFSRPRPWRRSRPAPALRGIRIWFTATTCKCEVELPVAATREAMTDPISAGHLYRSNLGVAGQRPPNRISPVGRGGQQA